MAGTLLFYNGSGKIAKLTGSVSGGFQIKIDGLTTTANVIITGVSLQQGVRISYFETMGASIYMYPLGNKISNWSIYDKAEFGLLFQDLFRQDLTQRANNPR